MHIQNLLKAYARRRMRKARKQRLIGHRRDGLPWLRLEPLEQRQLLTTLVELQSFEGITVPALPAGWQTSSTGSNAWVTVAGTSASAPNHAFVEDVDSVSDSMLVSPVFRVPPQQAEVHFRNSYDTQAGLDGGVLEISVNGGAFEDITVNGSFVTGGYNSTLGNSTSNPLGGRSAWSGDSLGYVDTIVNMPAAALGQRAQLRWRLGTDNNAGDTGWRVDTVRVSPSAGSATFFDSGQSLGTLNSTNVSLGDVDGDGDEDAFVANFGQGNVVWVNQGGAQGGEEGAFSDSGQILGASRSVDVGLGDFDGDGDLDAFVGNVSGQANRVWLNQGGLQGGTLGTFNDSGQELGTFNTQAVSLGDVDSDGDLDVFVANIYQPNRVWINQGGTQGGTAGVFADSAQALGAGSSTDVSLGDVDGDGDLDAFVVNFYAGNRIWVNQGGAQGGTAGTFSDANQALGRFNSDGVSLGDLDGDGDLDAFVANQNQGNRRWMNQGGAQGGTAGFFLDGGQSLGSFNSRDVNLGDVDGDGDLDAFVANQSQGNRVWVNQGGRQGGTLGSFGDGGQSLGASRSYGMSLGDVDGDGDLDAFIANFYTEPNHIWINQSDFGDAPDSFGTTNANDGARHSPVGPTLGAERDAEKDGLPTADATGDDASDTGSADDEDGVSFSPIFVGQLDAEVTVNVSGGTGRLDAWIDFNDDGTFDASNERIASGLSLATGDNQVLFDVPASAVSGAALVARFRLSTAGGLGPRGVAQDGEVEDHTVTLGGPGGSGLFDDGNQELGSSNSRGVGLGDLDGDGDVDAFVTNFGSQADRVWVNQGGGVFVDSGQSLGTSNGRGVSLGDVDGDGDLDAFVANESQGNQVWLNQGGAQGGTTGVFVDSGHSLGTSASRDVQLGDLDSDGDLDAFVAVNGQGNRVWLNQGGPQGGNIGTFADSGQELGTFDSRATGLGDLDGDGDMDAFVVNFNQANRVWLNEGGTFVDSSQALGSFYSLDVRLGDVDGDGDLDAFVTNVIQGGRVWLNQGGDQSGTPGTFSDSGQALGTDQSQGVDLGDFDGDGDLDAFVVTGGGQSQRVWINQGGPQNGVSGTFSLNGQSLGTGYGIGISLSDLDGDGDLDAFVASSNEGNRVWINRNLDFGDAPDTFGTTSVSNGARHSPSGPTLGSERDAESNGQPSADATGDDAVNTGSADDEDGVTFGTILVGQVNAGAMVSVAGTAGRLDAWIDFNDDGTFDGAGERIATSLAVAVGANVVPFDVPSDAVANEPLFARFRLSTAGGHGPRGLADDGEVEDHTVTLDFAGGSGTFDDSNQALGNFNSTSVRLGDLDNDGDLDAFFTNRYQGNRIWINTAGVLADSNQNLGTFSSRDASLGDVDGDGDLDVFVANYGAGNRVWLNQGGAQGGTIGVFSDSNQSLGASFSTRASLGDVDGDGDLDAFVANVLSGNQVWLNQAGAQGGAAGVFSDSGQSLGTDNSQGVSLGDVDGDGDLDAVVANQNQANRVWLNQGGAQSGTPGVFGDSGQTLGAFASYDVRLGDLDGDGDLDAFVVNTGQGDRIWLNQGGLQGGLSGTFADNNQSLGTYNASSLNLGDLDGDGDLDAVVTVDGAGNRVVMNQGGLQGGTAGIFVDSGQDLGTFASENVSLGDVDSDGDLDAVVANYGQANRVWINRNLDFGDAANTFGTTSANNGARHDASGPALGSERDVESNGQPSAGADADDVNNTGSADDEDGVTFGAITAGQVDAEVTVDVTVAAGSLDAWIDFNNDGTFDETGERIAHSQAMIVGSNTVAYDVPADAVTGQALSARFRLSTAGGLGPRGEAADGEVEDHTVSITAPGGSGIFADSGQSLAGLRANAARLADLDGDGDLDAFVINTIQANLVLINQGGAQSGNEGEFNDSGQLLGGIAASRDVGLGDVDGDGDLDAFVANRGSANRVWINQGGAQGGSAATFNDSGQSLGSNLSNALSLGDLDGDGDLDAFVANFGQGNRAWINQGGFQGGSLGTFNDSGQDLGTFNSTDVSLGDLDGDGDLDAFVTNDGEGNRIWVNQGGAQEGLAGVFADATLSLGSFASNSVRLGDLDGDDDLDAFVANASGQANRVWLNQSGLQGGIEGDFSDSGQALGTFDSLGVGLADVDGDGDLDAFVTNDAQGNRVWMNLGGVQGGSAGTFGDSGQSMGTSNSSDVSLGDVDSDGDLDAFIANYTQPNRVWLNQFDFGDAPDNFGTTVANNGARHTPSGPLLGSERDIEGDGQPSADATGDDANNTGSADDEDGVTFSTIAVGQLDAAVTVAVSGGPALLDAWIDFNNDGTFDTLSEQIATSESLVAGNNQVLFGVPAGAVSGQALNARFRLSTAGGLGPRGSAADGEVEDHTVTLAAPGGNGLFDDSGQALGTFNSRDIRVGDLDGDGDLDAFAVNVSQGNSVWINQGGSQAGAAGTFSDSGQSLGTSASYTVELGDLDGDGDLDAFVANYGKANRVWLNQGGSQGGTAGTFVENGQALGTFASYGVSLGDVDGDGDMDAFVSNFYEPNRVWLNQGGQQGGTAGTFGDSGQALGTFASTGVQLADLDGDGDLDAFVANVLQGNRVWLNQGGSQSGTAGEFSDTSQSLATYTSADVSLGDVDGDGDLDAIVANRSQGNRVWLNQGGAQGGTAAVFSDSGQALGAAVSYRIDLGDVDGDGDLDAFVANYAANSLWINQGGLQGGSAGTFGDSGQVLGNFYSYGLSVGDLDGDGDLDAFVANYGQGNRVWINRNLDFGDAPDTFGTTVESNGARHTALGPLLGAERDGEIRALPSTDATGDDASDTGSANDEDGVTFGTITVGQLDATATVTVAGGTGQLDAWLDFNNDGTFDSVGERIASSVTVAAGSNAVLFDVPADAVSGQPLVARFRLSTAGGLGPRGLAADGEVEDHTVTLGVDAGSGTLNDSRQSLGTRYSTDLGLGDLDGDGDLDAFVSNYNQGSGVWINQGGAQGGTEGAFSDSGQTLGSYNSNGVSVGDLDGDGDLDALVANYGQGNRVWINQGGSAATFSDSGQSLGTLNSYGVALGDLDSDGDLDAFVANRSGQGNTVWLNQGGSQGGAIGTFVDSGQSLGTFDSTDVNLGDLDGDGDLDAIVANYDQGNRVWLNQGGVQNGTAGVFVDSAQSLGDSYSYAVSLGDLDGDGDLDAFVANASGDENRVWINQGGLQGGTAGTFSDSGQALGALNSYDVSLGDVDGDGDLDALVANYNQGNRIWINQGGLQGGSAGVFLENGQDLGTFNSQAAAFGDLDGDGDLDGFVANRQQGNRVWFDRLEFGDATDTFGTLFASDGARHIPDGPILGTERDSENDGQPSIGAGSDDAVNSGSVDDEDGVTFGTIVVGQLDATATVTVTNGPGQLDAWIDFNDDGTFAEVGERIASSLTVVDGANTVQFDVPADAVSGQALVSRFRLSTAGGLGPRGAAADGEVEDHVVALGTPPTGSGVFDDSSQSLGSFFSEAVSLGDVDGDGDLDALTANVAGQGNRVWLNQGGAQSGSPGAFGDSGQSLGTSASRDVGLGDVDGDGDLDAFVVNTLGQGNRVWTNQGGAQGGTAGTFNDSGQSLGTFNSEGVSLGDVDGDGDQDAFVVNTSQGNRVWLNQGGAQGGTAGSFSDSGQSLGSANSRSVSLGDLDGDGDVDAMVANASGNLVWINQGGAQGGTAGSFSDSGQSLGTVDSLDLSLGDVDGDGDLDAFVANTGSNRVWVNQGGSQGGTAGTFSDSGQNLGTMNSRSVSLGDVDSDGDLDATVANVGGNRVWINQGNGQIGILGTFSDSGQSLGSYISFATSLGDLDGDGDLDSFVANRNQGNRVWLNQTVPAPNVTGEIVNGVGINNRSRVLTLTLQFDLDVTVSGIAALQVFNLTTGTPLDLSAAALQGNGTTEITWDLTNVTVPDGFYTAKLPRTEALSAGVPLAATHAILYHVLAGDSDGDAQVGFSDFGELATNFNVTGGPLLGPGDLDGDGSVGFSDFGILATNFNNSLTAPGLDFGDAPESGTSFPTTLANNGARHILGSGLFLGAAVDAELDGQPDATASAEGADDDGVTFGALQAGTNAAVTVTAAVPTTGVLNAWIDFNADGDWDEPGEHVFVDEPLANGANNLSVAIPAGAATGTAITRFRITSCEGHSYLGLATDGEVEDYQVILLAAALGGSARSAEFGEGEQWVASFADAFSGQSSSSNEQAAQQSVIASPITSGGLAGSAPVAARGVGGLPAKDKPASQVAGRTSSEELQLIDRVFEEGVDLFPLDQEMDDLL